MPLALYVHLAPAETILEHELDDNPEHGRPSALAEHGLWHIVENYENVPGTDKRNEGRIFHTACGIEQEEAPSRMDEAENEPGGARCPKCFKKG